MQKYVGRSEKNNLKVWVIFESTTAFTTAWHLSGIKKGLKQLPKSLISLVELIRIELTTS
jgi:hypothetical protein